jgi:hypothetical protein
VEPPPTTLLVMLFEVHPVPLTWLKGRRISGVQAAPRVERKSRDVIKNLKSGIFVASME